LSSAQIPPTSGLNQPTDPQSGTLLKRIRRRLWIVLLCALVGAAVAYHHASSKPQQYEASAQLLFGANTSVPAALGLSSGSNNSSSSAQATNAGLAGLPVISTLTQQALGSHVPPGGVNVSTEALGTTSLVEVLARSPKPSGAIAVVNEYAQQFVQYTQQQQLQQVNAAIAALRHEIAARKADGAGGGGNLGVALLNLETLQAANPVAVSVVQTATSASLVGRKTKTKAIEGLVLGAIVGVIIAMLLDWFDPKLREVSDAEFHGLRVISLGDLPKQGGSAATTAITRRLLSEASRQSSGPPQLIAITSTGTGPDAQFARHLAAALAQTAAADGSSAAIVRVAKTPNSSPVADQSGEGDFAADLTRTKLSEGVEATEVSPQALLHEAAARDLEAELRDSYRVIVVLDERPSEFSVLAQLVKAADVSALVVTLGRTRRRDAAAAAQALADMGCTNPVFVVFPAGFRAALQKGLALQPAS
jgi:capsular polysaccharide biosynthesis protein